jgi:hypothetical protein
LPALFGKRPLGISVGSLIRGFVRAVLVLPFEGSSGWRDDGNPKAH